MVERQLATKSKGSATSRPSRFRATSCAAGEAGFIFANIKTVSDAKIGDTITDAARTRRRSRFRDFRRSSRWCSPACIRSNRTSTACCATRSKSFG